MYANYYKFKNIKPNKENNNKKKTALKFTPTTLKRLEKIIAAKILMGIYKLPSINDYFSNDPLLNSPVKKIIFEWNYTITNMILHPCDINDKGADKINKLIEKVMKNCTRYYYPSRYVTIDERMISYIGKQEYVIYNPQKPSKYGFCLYILEDSESGYTYAMKILESPKETDYGKMYGVILELMEILKKK